MELENDAVLTARHLDTFNLFCNCYLNLNLKRKLLKHVLGEDFHYLTTTMEIPKQDGIQVKDNNVTTLFKIIKFSL